MKKVFEISRFEHSLTGSDFCNKSFSELYLRQGKYSQLFDK